MILQVLVCFKKEDIILEMTEAQKGLEVRYVLSEIAQAKLEADTEMEEPEEGEI